MALKERLVLVFVHGLRDEDLSPRTLPVLNTKGGGGLVIRRLLLESCDRPESEILTGRRPTEAGYAFELRRRPPGDRDNMLAVRLTLWRWIHKVFPKDKARKLAVAVTRIRPEETAGLRPELLRYFRRSPWPPPLRPDGIIASAPLTLAEAVVGAGGTADLSGLALQGTDDGRVAKLLEGGKLPRTSLTVTSLKDAAFEADRYGIASPQFRAAVQRTEAHLSRILQANEPGPNSCAMIVAAVRPRMKIERRIDAAALIRERAGKARLREGVDYLLLTEPRFARVWDLCGGGIGPLAQVFQSPPLSEHGRMHTPQAPLPGMTAVGTSYGEIVFAAAPGVLLDPNDRANFPLQAVQASALKPDQPAGFAILWSPIVNQGSFFEEVRGADLAATIATILGVSLPPRSPGRSLLPPARRPAQDGVAPPFVASERAEPSVTPVRSSARSEDSGS